MIGTRIFNYRITRLIGEGGMAKVYEAVHEKFQNRRVAIKILDPILTANADIRLRFENEAKIMASLDHPHIVKVMDYTDDADKLAIVMEYLEGNTVSDYVKKYGAFAPETASKMMVNILDAFQYAHQHGIIHRDVKPSNILLDDKLNPKIMDFGIAKLLTDNSLTRTGTQMGTPTYMSPEQVRDVKDIDKRSDIYSLGVTLYFMLTGSAPYNSTTLSTFDIYNKIVHEPLPPLTSNLHFNEIISKATAKNPADRYSSCKEMADAFTAKQNAAPFETPSADDEKTLIFTEQVKPKETKKQPVQSNPVVPEIKPRPTEPKPKPAPVVTEQGKKRFTPKHIIMASAAVIVIVAAIAVFTTGILGGTGRLNNSVDSVSYSLGVIEGQYLKERFDTISLSGLEKGIMAASRSTGADQVDQRVMFKYSRNNLKNNQYDEKECAGIFKNYGSYIFKNASGDMIYDLKNKLFFAGLKHVVTGTNLLISLKDAIEFSNSFPTSKSKMETYNMVAVEKVYFNNLKTNSRVKQASNGVFYEIISEGSGALPNSGSSLYLKIDIKNLNGDVLLNIPENYFSANALIPGLQEVVKKMKKGSFYRIYVPSRLAYGAIGLNDDIKPYQALICEVEMVTFFL